MTRWCSSFLWAFACWMVLTWSVEAEQLVAGGLLAAVVATANRRLGTVIRPWALLAPRRLAGLLRLGATVAGHVGTAGLSLAWCIWSGRRPRSGMVRVASAERTDGQLAGVGLLTSLTPDTQLVDLDRSRSLLLYYTLQVRATDAEQREATTGGIERGVARIS